MPVKHNNAEQASVGVHNPFFDSLSCQFIQILDEFDQEMIIGTIDEGLLQIEGYFNQKIYPSDRLIMFVKKTEQLRICAY